jgi:hypothetical protein
MTISIAPQYTQRHYKWTDWLAVYDLKKFIYQCDQDDLAYTIWGYDGPEVHICQIWKGDVPDAITVSYSQYQNDLDKTEFETNYLSQANGILTKLTASGIIGQAPAKGLGGFAPDPTNNPYQPSPDEVVSLYVDGEGSLVTRGAAITDEGSLRDDFTGSDIVTDLTGNITFTNGSDVITGSGTSFTTELNRDRYIKLSTDGYTTWAKILRAPTDTTAQLDGVYSGTTGSGTGETTRWLTWPIGGTPGSYSVSSSKIILTSGTNSSGGYILYREGDYLPMLATWVMSLSQMINNQTAFFGFRDDLFDPNMYCDVTYPGSDPTVITFRSAWNKDEQSTTVTLPAGLDATQSLRYKIDVSPDYCGLTINGVLVARHDSHVPDPYIEMYLCAGIYNTGATSNTNMQIDSIYWSNQDQLQISSNFITPLNVITKEDQNSIYGKLTTSSTSADQVIISYTVPAGKVFYIIGYNIESSGTLNGNPIKIGRNTVTSEAAAPGTVDGNIFRCFTLSAGASTGDVDLGGNPRKLGIGGDVIKVTVTPSGLLSSVWRASLDFVLR